MSMLSPLLSADVPHVDDDIPPLPCALARRQGARRLCRPGRHRAGACVPLFATKRGRGRQAKVLTNDEARRIAINVARLAELLGKADRD